MGRTVRPWTSARSSRCRWSSAPRTIPPRTYGFLGVVVSTEDLSASVWTWHKDGERWG